MEAHRIDWGTTTVESGEDRPDPRFTLRVKLEGALDNAWRERFTAYANVHNSAFIGLWRQVELEGDEVVVHDLDLSRELKDFSSLCYVLLYAVVRADRRGPTPKEKMADERAIDIPYGGTGQTMDLQQRAMGLTDHFRALP
jgi:hypothetical protein